GRRRASRWGGGTDAGPPCFVRIGPGRARLGGAAGGGRHAGHDDNSDVRLPQVFELFAAAAEDERIAALEPYNCAPAPRRFDEAAIDLILADAGMPAPLADENALRVPARPINNARRHQLVIE